jgi:hypothetical protein
MRNGHTIALDAALVHRHGRAVTEEVLARIVRSTRVELDERGCAFRILGPDTPYHAIDTHLAGTVARLDAGLSLSQVVSYRKPGGRFDLCFEDSWSGFFVAAALEAAPELNDVTLIHLDHHTDMMSTLLELVGSELVDPARNAPFSPASASDWEKSIESGCIGIGSFVTALFYLPGKLHVLHLNDFDSSTYSRYPVVRAARSYPLIPRRMFAGIRKLPARPDERTDDALGSYLGGPDARRVLDSLPSGRVLVHIDLDYFINDFNGNPGPMQEKPRAEQQREAQRKMDEFFAALTESGSPVERWIIATSPGFCSARHWGWLLGALEERIGQYSPKRTAQ